MRCRGWGGPAVVPHRLWVVRPATRKHGERRSGLMDFKIKSSNNDTSTKRARSPIQALWPPGRVNPINGCQSSKWIRCTFESYQKPKRKNHTCKNGLRLESSWCNCRRLKLLEQYRKKKVVAASGYKWQSGSPTEKDWSHTAASCSTQWLDIVKPERWTTVSLYLNELLGWKL